MTLRNDSSLCGGLLYQTFSKVFCKPPAPHGGRGRFPQVSRKASEPMGFPSRDGGPPFLRWICHILTQCR
ncbi:hypothetical protein BJX66DRAFT_303293 [Aspergillus keveii]|uniref:Uncharacterized protein n=1 Tax=Aspergillus keveii TaxID=714993 RepID=A0ABR4G7U9_9EURO